MLTIENMINDYTNWLKSNISIDKINNYYEIVTPFLDRHNDSISIYINKNSNDRIVLTDGGKILNDLIISGIDITPNRKKIISSILLRYGVNLSDDYDLYTYTDKNHFPLKKHFLIQAMLSVDDLFMTSRKNVTNIFIEEIEAFLEENKIDFFENFSLVGKSGYTHNFDYALPKTQNNPERLLKGINRPTKDNSISIIFSWNDVAGTRKHGTKLLVFLNDTESNVNQDVINAFNEYEIISIKWTERNNYLNLLCK